MSGFLWSGLNVLVVLALLYLFFRVIILVKQYLGTGVAVLFIFGLLLISCRPTEAPALENINLLAGAAPTMLLGNASSRYSIPLGMGGQLQLLAEYQQEQQVVRPRGLYVLVSGLLIGHTWRPLVGRVKQAGQQLHYYVVMQHSWKLLRWTIFSEAREFEGLMPIAAAS
ncbi:MAG: hypothetical protein EOO62_08295 [Hymenobacter sp.]|nr:MAG: hypothetical protein EOO62_08295 [Hymenobacter sp.]